MCLKSPSSQRERSSVRPRKTFFARHRPCLWGLLHKQEKQGWWCLWRREQAKCVCCCVSCCGSSQVEGKLSLTESSPWQQQQQQPGCSGRSSCVSHTYLQAWGRRWIPRVQILFSLAQGKHFGCLERTSCACRFGFQVSGKWRVWCVECLSWTRRKNPGCPETTFCACHCCCQCGLALGKGKADALSPWDAQEKRFYRMEVSRVCCHACLALGKMRMFWAEGLWLCQLPFSAHHSRLSALAWENDKVCALATLFHLACLQVSSPTQHQCAYCRPLRLSPPLFSSILKAWLGSGTGKASSPLTKSRGRDSCDCPAWLPSPPACCKTQATPSCCCAQSCFSSSHLLTCPSYRPLYEKFQASASVCHPGVSAARPYSVCWIPCCS